MHSKTGTSVAAPSGVDRPGLGCFLWCLTRPRGLEHGDRVHAARASPHSTCVASSGARRGTLAWHGMAWSGTAWDGMAWINTNQQDHRNHSNLSHTPSISLDSRPARIGGDSLDLEYPNSTNVEDPSTLPPAGGRRHGKAPQYRESPCQQRSQWASGAFFHRHHNQSDHTLIARNQVVKVLPEGRLPMGRPGFSKNGDQIRQPAEGFDLAISTWARVSQPAEWPAPASLRAILG